VTQNQLHVKHKQNAESIWENINKSHVSRIGMWVSCVLEDVIGSYQIPSSSSPSPSSDSITPFIHQFLALLSNAGNPL
jgi:hypothetical protein